ncbi:hypothetical protein KDA_39320 [Dictyobacter alpinus]|uniref:DUF1684 domain-containing protein n=1 Tax=Dictyobacter alpinus TaxID=2014873 RepID=A0A402BAL6_9CHLR|nr:DUF1684 domain-containing protein [Dictyobacter alpinus]GCE28448.1 hypothetical protein KDA_39320 [Dictyobacter alpinus]
MSDYLDLYDYRGRVMVLYQERNRALSAGEDAEAILQRFRAGKDALFAQHPQSALDAEQRRQFQGLRYFPYNPTLRLTAPIDTDVEPVQQQIAMNGHENMSMTTIGNIHFSVDGTDVKLSIYWLDIYGGGLFLPFRDTTCPAESYGGGRYLFDTIKGSDTQLDREKQQITLDFNYAYNPSCAYNSRWVCPLAPLENRLPVAIRAGELAYTQHDMIPEDTDTSK